MQNPYILYIPVVVKNNHRGSLRSRAAAEQTLMLSTAGVKLAEELQTTYPELQKHLNLDVETRPACSPTFELKRGALVKLAILANWIKQNTPEDNSPEARRLQHEFYTLDQAMKAIQTVLAV